MAAVSADDRADKAALMAADIAASRQAVLSASNTSTSYAPLRAHRTCKARRSSRCLLGRDLINVGDSIGRVVGWGWVHCRCVIAANEARR